MGAFGFLWVLACSGYFGCLFAGAGFGFVLLLVLVGLVWAASIVGGLCGFDTFGWVVRGLEFEPVVDLLRVVF